MYHKNLLAHCPQVSATPQRMYKVNCAGAAGRLPCHDAEFSQF